MTTGDIILHIFCFVDDHMPKISRHPQAKSYPIELIFSIRQRRSAQQLGKKGRNKGRWNVGVKQGQHSGEHDGLKKILHRLKEYIQARLAFLAAMFNVLLGLFHSLHPRAEPCQMSIAEFAL